jgi:Zn-dependent peptidase ImmA (M78 family)
MLAIKYQAKAGIDRLPVPNDLITQAADNLPIEVRQVPLKAYHGAVWRLSDCWLIHLNSNDTPARQRFTLYHEIFHILAHCKATPVFKKTSHSHKGTFNELLADHFAAIILLPENWVKEKWLELKDVSQMAAIFDVPKPIMYLGLKAMRLV